MPSSLCIFPRFIGYVLKGVWPVNRCAIRWLPAESHLYARYNWICGVFRVCYVPFLSRPKKFFVLPLLLSLVWAVTLSPIYWCSILLKLDAQVLLLALQSRLFCMLRPYQAMSLVDFQGFQCVVESVLPSYLCVLYNWPVYRFIIAYPKLRVLLHTSLIVLKIFFIKAFTLSYTALTKIWTYCPTWLQYDFRLLFLSYIQFI